MIELLPSSIIYVTHVLLIKLTHMHVRVKNVADGDAYELIVKPINKQQLVEEEEVELIEGPT